MGLCASTVDSAGRNLARSAFIRLLAVGFDIYAFIAMDVPNLPKGDHGSKELQMGFWIGYYTCQVISAFLCFFIGVYHCCGGAKQGGRVGPSVVFSAGVAALVMFVAYIIITVVFMGNNEDWTMFWVILLVSCFFQALLVALTFTLWRILSSGEAKPLNSGGEGAPYTRA